MNSIFSRPQERAHCATSADMTRLEGALREIENTPMLRALFHLATLDQDGTPVACCFLGRLAETRRQAEGGHWETHVDARYESDAPCLPEHVAEHYGLSNTFPVVDLTRLDQDVAEQVQAFLQTNRSALRDDACISLSSLSDGCLPDPLLTQVARQGLIPRGEA